MPDTTFHVRIGHLVPDAPALDFLVDGYPVLTDREFGQIPDYTEHEAAEYTVSGRRRDDGETLVETPVDFQAGAYHTLLLIGTAADPEFRLLTDGEA